LLRQRYCEMKLHINTEAKTIAIEGTVKISIVFNYLMSWFPEDWEEWSFIPFAPTVQYKEIIVEKEVWRNPYWNPWDPIMYATKGFDTGDPIVNPTYVTSATATLNFNNLA